MATLDFHFQDSPLSPVFEMLGDDNCLEIHPSSSTTGLPSSDVDLFKYFLNEEELDASTSSDSIGGSPQYDSLNSSPPPVPSFESSPSPQIADFMPIKLEKGYDSGCDSKKRKVKEEGTPSPVRVLIPKTIESTQAFSYSSAPPDEDRHVKRQRRLIKNRESAQLSRMRKKIYIDDLERKVSVLTQDNDILTKRVASLVNDNLLLTEKVNNLTNMLKQNQTQRRSVATNASTTNKNLKTAGVCMLMILFSFGLFFNIKGGERYREQYHVGRMLASIEEDQTPALAASLGGRAVGSGSSSALLSEEQAGAIIPKRNLPRKRSSSEVEEKKKGMPSDVELESSSITRRKVIKIQTNNHDTTEKKMMGGMESEEVGLVPVSQQAQVPVPVTSGTLLSPQFAQSIVRREDTNYIYCSEPQNVFTEDNQTPRRDEQGRVINQPLISLLMPASNLNATFGGRGFGDADEAHALLEITCQIMNINVYPGIPLSNNSQTVS